MMIYVNIAIDRITDLGHILTKDEIKDELHYLAYNCNKKGVMLKKILTFTSKEKLCKKDTAKKRVKHCKRNRLKI